MRGVECVDEWASPCRSAVSRSLAGLPEHLIADGMVDMVVFRSAGKQPNRGFTFEATPVLTQCLQRFGLSTDEIMILRPFAPRI